MSFIFWLRGISAKGINTGSIKTHTCERRSREHMFITILVHSSIHKQLLQLIILHYKSIMRVQINNFCEISSRLVWSHNFKLYFVFRKGFRLPCLRETKKCLQILSFSAKRWSFILFVDTHTRMSTFNSKCASFVVVSVVSPFKGCYYQKVTKVCATTILSFCWHLEFVHLIAFNLWLIEV